MLRWLLWMFGTVELVLLLEVIRRLRRANRGALKRWEIEMATLQDVLDSIGADEAATQAAVARVATDLGNLSAQVQALSDQIAAGAGVTAADLDTVKAGIDAVTGEVAGIDPAAPPV